MSETQKNRPSFSLLRRFGIFLNVVLSVLAVLALLVMANYLASGYYKRTQLSTQSQWDLSPQTLNILQTLTNDVKVTIFFDQSGDDELYGWASGLLKEYRNLNPKIQVKSIDYTRAPSEAKLFLSEYKLTLSEQNFVLFDSGGRTRVVYASHLTDSKLEQISQERLEFRKKITGFRGELLFTSAIFDVTHPRSLKAYFVWGHGEHDPENETAEGYSKFAAVLKEENNIDWQKLSLRGTNEVPSDCQLLIIAGPGKAQFADTELTAIENYLDKGGRSLVLLNNLAIGGNSGIEKTLAKWGVAVSNNIVFDKDFQFSNQDLLAAEVNPNHPVTKTMYAEGLQIQLVLPRSLDKITSTSKPADAPKVEVLFQTSSNAVARTLSDQRNYVGNFPLAVAVERGEIRGIAAERGATRMIVLGDSLCLNNHTLDSAANHYFAGFAANWLLAQPSVLLEGLGPRPIKEYTLKMTEPQKRVVQWILLGGMPGSVLLIGSLVWLRRRS